MHKLYGVSRRIYDKNGKEIVFAKGDGGYVYDLNGKSYIDMLLGYGPIILGHGNKKYADELAKVIAQGYLFPSYGEKQYELADHISEHYQNHQLISFYQSGSDSLDSVFRICKFITGKTKLIRFGYIGWHDNLLAGGINWHEPLNSSVFFKQCNFLPGIEDDRAYNWDGQSVESFEQLTKDDNIACFIFDVYQLERQKLPIEAVIEICKKKNILVVLDETKTAGRVSTYGFYKDKLEYDFTILGKAISNGYPVSLLLGYKDYEQVSYDSIKIAGTYARDCLGCNAVMTTAQLMQKEHLYEAIGETGKKIAQMMNYNLENITKTSDLRVNVMLDGAILEFEYSNQFACDFEARKKLTETFLHHGLLIQDGHCFYICAAHANCLGDIEISFCESLKAYFG